MPSHHLNQCWHIYNWPHGNTFQWNSNKNAKNCIQENIFENEVCETTAILSQPQCVNTLRLRKNCCHLPEDILKCIFLNENIWISLNISLKFVPKDWINNILALVQMMAWRRLDDKPLSDPMIFCLLTHICITRPQWLKYHACWWLGDASSRGWHYIMTQANNRADIFRITMFSCHQQCNLIPNSSLLFFLCSKFIS